MSSLLSLDKANKSLIILMYAFQTVLAISIALFWPGFWSWDESHIVSWVLVITVGLAYHKRPIIENLLLTISPWASLLIVSILTTGLGLDFMYNLGRDTIAFSAIYIMFSLVFGSLGFVLGRLVREITDYIAENKKS